MLHRIAEREQILHATEDMSIGEVERRESALMCFHSFGYYSCQFLIKQSHQTSPSFGVCVAIWPSERRWCDSRVPVSDSAGINILSRCLYKYPCVDLEVKYKWKGSSK
jgi:hypothetical protein